MKESDNKSHRQIISYNKELGHSFVPSINARLLDDKGGYFIKTNSLGFRSNIEFKEKKEGRRILFFGDSNTAADGVCNEERYSELLGKYFDAEVFNYAISGTGTDQQYLIWEKFAKKIEADLIVIGVLVENIERNNYFANAKALMESGMSMKSNNPCTSVCFSFNLFSIFF